MCKGVIVAEALGFEAFYRTEFPRLVSLATLKTGRVDVARELAQETLARAHAHWAEIATYDSPEAWCRRVLTNLLIDHHRTSAAERRAVERLEGRAAPAPRPASDGWERLVAPLPDRQRLIVSLFYGDDLTVQQIAQMLDTTQGAVKASLFKARRTLRRRLDEENSHG